TRDSACGRSHGEWAAEPMAPCLLQSTSGASYGTREKSNLRAAPTGVSEPATFTHKEESGSHATVWRPEDTASTTRQHGSLWSRDHRGRAHACPSHNVGHPNAAEG